MKTLFFFGSGADSNYCDKLKSGQEFASALLLGKFKEEAEKLNGEEFKTYKLIYPTSTKVYLQTIASYPEDARNVIDGEIVDMCLKYIEKNDDVVFKDIKTHCGEWYKIVTDKTNSTGIREFFLNHAVFFNSLDEKFNSLRFTKLDDNAKRVIDAYTQVFVLMLKSVYDIESNFPWNYDAVFQKLNAPYDITNNSNKTSYYSTLKNSRLKYNVVTTNYTSLAEKITENPYTIYLHGKLTWFEDLKKLTVFDCTDRGEYQLLKQSNRILPFILIPSGVKPLICPRQIREFAKFIDVLSDTDTLVVVGYKFNSEDNHINSIIVDWLRNQSKRMIYINYNNDVRFDGLEWALEFPIVSVEQFDRRIMNQSNNQKIIVVSADSQSCNETFEKILSYLEEIS